MESITIPGVFLSIFGHGVLVTGKNGIGKSRLALEMLSRGHALIADDAPRFAPSGEGVLKGVAPTGLGDFLMVPGLGIVNVRALFGDGAVKSGEQLGLIINLVQCEVGSSTNSTQLHPHYGQQEFLQISVPELQLPIVSGCGNAISVEVLVRNHELQQQGYDPVEDFNCRQRHLMEIGA